MQIKAAMLDMARVTERHEWYEALLPRLAAWGYNTVFLHFTDNEGCALEFPSHPELATPFAYSVDEMTRFIAEAGRHGLTIIPELESFGHTGFIHRLPQYHHLREPTVAGRFNAINPLHEETLAILKDLIRDTADIFDAPYIHAGLDEVGFGGGAQTREALKHKQLHELYADHVNFIHEQITKAGKQMMMWGDHIATTPAIADLISNDIVICHWKYTRDIDPTPIHTLLEKGFEVICAPACLRSGEIILPSATTQINLQRFAHLAHQAGPKIVGLMNTYWEPGRIVTQTGELGMALGGAWFHDPAADPETVIADYVAQRFGLAGQDATNAGQAMLELSAIAPQRHTLLRLLGIIPETQADPLTHREAHEARELRTKADAARTKLTAVRDQVSASGEVFDNYILAADVIDWACRVALARAFGESGDDRNELAGQGDALLERVRADWGRGRYAEDRKRDSWEGREGAQHMTAQLDRAVHQLRSGDGAKTEPF